MRRLVLRNNMEHILKKIGLVIIFVAFYIGIVGVYAYWSIESSTVIVNFTSPPVKANVIVYYRDTISRRVVSVRSIYAPSNRYFKDIENMVGDKCMWWYGELTEIECPYTDLIEK